MNPDRLVAEIAARQGGAIRSDQARASGLTKGQIDRRLRDGRWQSLGRFGYQVIEMSGAMSRVRAAIATLPNAVVSHDSAAELHNLPKLRRGLASVLVHSRTTHDFPGVVVHRCHDLLDGHLEEIDGLPVTSVSRTIIDLSPFLSKKHIAAILDSTIADQRICIGEVELVVDQVARRGKPGIQKMRSILEERQAGPPNGSPLERRGAEVLRAGGLPEPRFEFPIPWDPDRRFDAAFPVERLAIEWDSRRWHELADAFSRDRERDRQALVHGWRVVRFTWIDVTERPAEIVEIVGALLDQGRSSNMEHSAG
jgi:very-short-patch-repair endonuclease